MRNTKQKTDNFRRVAGKAKKKKEKSTMIVIQNCTEYG